VSWQSRKMIHTGTTSLRCNVFVLSHNTHQRSTSSNTWLLYTCCHACAAAAAATAAAAALALTIRAHPAVACTGTSRCSPSRALPASPTSQPASMYTVMTLFCHITHIKKARLRTPGCHTHAVMLLLLLLLLLLPSWHILQWPAPAHYPALQAAQCLHHRLHSHHSPQL
jgi:hypothetical protein